MTADIEDSVVVRGLNGRKGLGILITLFCLGVIEKARGNGIFLEPEPRQMSEANGAVHLNRARVKRSFPA